MEWIKCSERMPDIGQLVLIRIPISARANIESAKYEGDGQFLGAWFSMRVELCCYSVTHWMPRPEEPAD